MGKYYSIPYEHEYVRFGHRVTAVQVELVSIVDVPLLQGNYIVVSPQTITL